ncbi:Hpt domain-containing protein [Glaciimonas sp. PAMC28666]|uniref:Hpt domain-containing protein n=1 Tax=Glaciimonas sp. PAMC28666 TaxID=2807626 RepID=UPI00196686C5|nr:Hpt domain-containing protein [Glaciimonas sp. PAMC28666]QRX82846.1 Hpt domain-containing protein [Glaciimonas sp. PAMC28666]
MTRHNPYLYIDPSVLFNATGEDLDSFRALSHTFLTIAPPMFERLIAAILAEQIKAISHEIHSFKGTTSLVGAVELTRKLEELENTLANEVKCQLAQHVPELWRLFSLVMQDVRDSIVHFRGNS